MGINKVALLINRDMRKRVFKEIDIEFLKGFSDINPTDDLPEKVTADFMRESIA